MITTNGLIAVALAYVAFLFLIAAIADREVQRGHFGWLRSPLVYTLSLSVYCTAWTFFGAVGSAARNGMEFVAIYLGPTLVFVGWYWLLRKLVRVGRTQRITSIADLVSSRYGKSTTIAVIVTLLAILSATPYIALQLQSLTLAFEALATDGAEMPSTATAWSAVGLAAFTILFGTRHVDANERHHGVVTAIAFEALVKLVALLAVGIYVVFVLFPGPAAVFEMAPPEMLSGEVFSSSRWLALNALAAMAVFTLPRMVQVMVVENEDERHLAAAAWAFPAYLFLISLFVMPIAIAGLATPGVPDNPDLFVLTLPMAMGQTELALLAFLGGLSAATSMVIISTIALATMVSNHVVMPVWLWARAEQPQTSGDVRGVLLLSRRLAIIGIIGLGYLYFSVSGGSAALASIGLIAFTGMAQLVPALLLGLFWRGATQIGAGTGIIVGAILWAYTLFLPSFGGGIILADTVLTDGPWGIGWLAPSALFGSTVEDPLVHAMLWSLSLNTLLVVIVSLLTEPSALERVQSALFVDVFREGAGPRPVAAGRVATSEDLYTLAQRILGSLPAHQLFAEAAKQQNKPGGLPDPTPDFIEELERLLSGSMGSASAHAMISQIAGGSTVSVDDLMNIADETAQIVQYSQRLETQSRELETTARQLRSANARLTELGAQKDAFLSQVSHELRTPMTSIRAFTDILRETPDLDEAEVRRFVGIIGQESERLTRLLDEILDLSFLESGRSRMDLGPVEIGEVIDRALASALAHEDRHGVQIIRDRTGEAALVMADFDRLAQVLINLFTNALKYGDATAPEITIDVRRRDETVTIDVHDNGPGIAESDRERVFEKFTRLSSANVAGSAGLGLAISLEIMRNLGGNLEILPEGSGTTFRASLRPAEGLSGRAAE